MIVCPVILEDVGGAWVGDDRCRLCVGYVWILSLLNSGKCRIYSIREASVARRRGVMCSYLTLWNCCCRGIIFLYDFKGRGSAFSSIAGVVEFGLCRGSVGFGKAVDERDVAEGSDELVDFGLFGGIEVEELFFREMEFVAFVAVGTAAAASGELEA